MNYLINNGAELISDIETDNNISDTGTIPITIYSSLSDNPSYYKFAINKPVQINTNNTNSNIFSKPKNNPSTILNNIMKVFPNINETVLEQTENIDPVLEQNENNNPELEQNENNGSISNTENNIMSFLNSKPTSADEYKHDIQQNTDDFVKILQQSIEGTNLLNGGNQNTSSKVIGTRNMRTYSELTEAINMFGGESEDMSDLVRIVENKSTKYHKEALSKILTFLKDKNDIILAKSVKALIYREIKKNQPELSNLDRAMEILNAITQDKVKQILKQTNEIEKIREHLMNKTTVMT
jgi:hypothetical protein